MRVKVNLVDTTELNISTNCKICNDNKSIDDIHLFNHIPLCEFCYHLLFTRLDLLVGMKIFNLSIDEFHKFIESGLDALND